MRTGMQCLYFVRTSQGIMVPRRCYVNRCELLRAVKTLRRRYPGERIKVVKWKVKEWALRFGRDWN
jgi:hypothetical protein